MFRALTKVGRPRRRLGSRDVARAFKRLAKRARIEAEFNGAARRLPDQTDYW